MRARHADTLSGEVPWPASAVRSFNRKGDGEAGGWPKGVVSTCTPLLPKEKPPGPLLLLLLLLPNEKPPRPKDALRESDGAVVSASSD